VSERSASTEYRAGELDMRRRIHKIAVLKELSSLGAQNAGLYHAVIAMTSPA